MSESETPVPTSPEPEETAAADAAADVAAPAVEPAEAVEAPSAPAPEPAADDASPEAPAEEAAEPAAADAPAAEAPSADAPDAEASAAAAPAPTPSPRPRPGRPGPTPGGAPSPAALAGRKPAAPLLPAAPSVTEYDAALLAEAKTFGAVTEDGTVTVQDGTQVRTLGEAGQAQGIDPETALDPFARAYLDLVAFLDLTEKKLSTTGHTHNELNRLLENLRKNMKEPQVVGDIPALRARAHELREKAKAQIAELESARTAARQDAIARRTAFVESIEQLVATPPEQISWKSAGETMRQMVPTWKQMQSEDVNLDRPTEDALWKRLSAARSTFDRHRKQFFSQLDERHEEAAAVKEQLIARAEEMQDSTDWGPTVRAFKDLMAEWRAAPRGGRKKDDAQWARFKAAQDTFFAARNADLEASEAEQRENLVVKEALLAEAEQIDPTKDLDRAKDALRSVQERWEAAGKVPRGDMRRIDDRLRSVERAVKDAEEAEWRRTDPRTKARVEGASSQLHSAIAGYEEDLEKARATGDPAKIAKAEAALEARREWLAVIERSARDLG
ncbi:DUF349 domain-containing protein [Brachybacterium sp. NBEC-018]|uniref:DUF349 domain-containing protein n=1 Tax=Brachybacterium sp. NBEC-018 TaxID=2996004 RepID=UPI0021753B3E|nr:DUF349 domain-containing protein [Brachybacterium sp. NBEC-018]UVY83134.1 DUF349 domain-containing protein [Brachybacterium sp. NBEC-018]